MTAGREDDGVGRAGVTKYEAAFEPDGDGEAERVVVDERQGATLEADAFARGALHDLPDGDGRIVIANLPEEQAARLPDEEMPENQ